MKTTTRVAAIVLVAIAGVSYAVAAPAQTTAPAPPTATPPDRCQHNPLAQARGILKEAWDREGWRQRNPVKKQQSRALSQLRSCLDRPGREKLAAYAAKLKGDFKFHRSYRRTAPFTGFRGEGYMLRWLAIPAWVVAAETRGYSGEGRWRAFNPSGACGPYQLLGWTSCDTSSDADKLRHHRVAATLPRGSWAVGY